LAVKFLAALKAELADERAAWEKAQVDAETLAWAVEDLKKMTDKFTAHIPTLEEKVKHLDNRVLDSLNSVPRS
jgi:hypothetical protein